MVVVVLYLGVRLRMQQVDIEDITVSHLSLNVCVCVRKISSLFYEGTSNEPFTCMYAS